MVFKKVLRQNPSRCSHPRDPNNNQPISLLPVLSKVAERFALIQFNEFLTKQNKLTQHQSRNHKNRSMETLSLLVTDHIFGAIDQQQLTAMVLIDLSKAFDSICHSTLLLKLSSLGTSSQALKWFESYLTDRKQSTRLGTSLSDELTITHGVPQGSILGYCSTYIQMIYPPQLSPAVPTPTLMILRSTAPFRLKT